MARSAKLTSIDAVREMAVALSVFGDEATAALDDLDINVRRAIDWISHDRKDYWTTELRRSYERLGEAQAELHKALTYRKVGDYTPSCREERAIVEKAKRRAQMAEEVNRSLPGWAHRIEHAVRELTGAKTLLADWLHGELPRALSALNQMNISLETYAASSPPTRKPTTAATTPEADADRPADDATDPAEDKEQNDENVGSPLARRQTAAGDEGSEGG